MFDLSRLCLANPFCKHPYFFVRVLYWCSLPCLQGRNVLYEYPKEYPGTIEALFKTSFYSSENCLNFQGCFTVQLSRFFACLAPSVFFLSKVSLARQQVISYQNFLHLSTLFLIFFKMFFLCKKMINGEGGI